MDLETFWYELFPYLYGIGGVIAVSMAHESHLLKASGVLLIVAALTIFRLRWVYRRRQIERMPTAAQIARLPVDDD